MNDSDKPPGTIAVIGMTGRFPGAGTIEAFWRNLCDGRETISFFTDEELAAAGVDAPRNEPRYVKARGVVERAEWFDAAYFGITPGEAEVIDPQQRVFLECSAEALERAGYDPQRFDGLVGVFAGASWNSYVVNNLYSHEEYRRKGGSHQIGLGNEKDYLPTRVSYKLNLRGPSINVQTACSTSLSAVCVACQSLLQHQCDMAIAGGASLAFPAKHGYWHQEGGIFSPDGHCRPFDAAGRGTVLGDGVALVVLKRFDEAMADGDQIYAAIRGFAINNDGAIKGGFAAPSVDGQSDTIEQAMAMAGVEPGTIGYVETHGTGTVIGDPIEFAGLSQAFAGAARGSRSCALGSVKGNIGHLDAAAGAAGLIKAVLSLHHRALPPSLHFHEPNPQIDMAGSPFYVNERLREWVRSAAPRRAGVSSLGIGGTNVHVVLEEAGLQAESGPSRPAQLLTLSAKSATALDQATANLAAHLAGDASVNLPDVAYTLQVGRREHGHRRVVVARNISGAVEALKRPHARKGGPVEKPPSIAFLFPGQGAQWVNMGRELFDHEPLFREEVDRCAVLLLPLLGFDVRTVLYPAPEDADAARWKLDRTEVTQPALFTVEYAMARLWMSWGIVPDAVLGHSLGEWVAACIAGVFSLDTALRLVAERARLMQLQAAGSMLAVRMDERELRKLLGADHSLAAVNGEGNCVVSGSSASVGRLEKDLLSKGIACRPLKTTHAFHSAMMEPALAPFAAFVEKLPRFAPRITCLSNVTGKPLSSAQAADPGYWASQIRQPVRFADGLAQLLSRPGRLLIEVGPGRILSSLAAQHPARNPGIPAIASLPAVGEKRGLDDVLKALGEAWAAGAPVDWHAFSKHERRKRVLLPTYPYERRRHWIEPAKGGCAPAEPAGGCTPAVPASLESGVKSPTSESNAPANVLGRLLALLEEISRVDLRNRISASFAELGFDSLLLAQFASAVEREFGVRIAFRDLLGSLGTVESLAGRISNDVRPQACSAAVPEAAAGVFPLSDPQRDIWLACQKSAAASCAYNESRRLEFRGPLQTALLQKALQQLMARHDALRTSFARSGESQRSDSRSEIALKASDLSALGASECRKRLEEIEAGEAGKPFDLENGPPLRVKLVRTGQDEHVLFVTVHHIVCDGQAWGILLNDLAAFYSAAVRGESGAKAPPLQIGFYALALAGRSELPEAKAAEDWWRRQFEGGVPVLELPTDRPRRAVMDFSGARAIRIVAPGLRRQLRDLSARQGCTLFTTLLAACCAWLERLGGQSDLVLGVPVAERSQAGAETLVAHCIDFLPLRIRMAGDDSFAGLLARVKEIFLEANEHRACSFGRILRASGAARDPSRPPLASVSFNFGRMGGLPEFSGLQTSVSANSRSFGNFELGLDVREEGDDLRVECHYSAALFDAGTINRWLGHFETLLASLAADPSRRVADGSMLSDTERNLLLAGWNCTRAEYAEVCVHRQIEAQAARTPNATAVVDGEKALDYGELNRRAEALAWRLRESGVGPDCPVGICLERTSELVVAVLAVLKAGGAYLPLDPSYPAARLAFMLEDSAAPVLLTHTRLRDNLSPVASTVVCIDEMPAVQRSAAAPPVSEAGLNHLAYVIYTSGSTGKPKGVAVEHRSIAAHVAWAHGAFSADELKGVLASTSLSFDLSVFELFVPLTAGGTVILAENALALQSLPAAKRVTLMNTVPSAAAELLRLGAIPASVRTINLAGEALAQDLVDRLHRLPGVRRVLDLYGPTEDTVYSTCAVRQPAGRATIGRPISNKQIYILDSLLRPVPIGVPGEIYIGGIGLARGYLNRPELTAERFPENPFELGKRMYRTGDRARYLPDGQMEFLGRLDFQVKLRGRRIELGEIESMLRLSPAVADAVAVVRPEGGGQLAAYVVSRGPAAADEGELRSFLSGSLPAHLVPTSIVSLPALPRTQNGKVDRAALPAPHPVAVAPSEPPATGTEVALSEIWSGLLGRKSPGRRENLLDHGGHSLLVTQFTVRVRDAFHVEVPIRRVFESPTIAALGAIVEELVVAQIDGMTEDEARLHATASSPSNGA